MKIRKIIAITSALVLCASATSCDLEAFFNGESEDTGSSAPAVQTDFHDVLDPDVHELVTDSNYKTIDNNDGINFETGVTEEEAASGTEIGLYDTGGNKVSDLYDDGTHGDRIANDRIYACNYDPQVKTEDEVSYTVKVGDTETAPVTVKYFDMPTAEDFKEVDEVNSSFEQLVKEYQDKDGYIKEDKKSDAISKAAELAEQMVKDGRAYKYHVNEAYGNVVVKLSSGITYIYENREEGKDNASANPKLEVTVYHPCKSGYNFSMKWGCSKYDDAADYISELDNISDCGSINDGKASRQAVRNFSSNEIILWDGHGGCDPKELHEFVVLGEKSDGEDTTGSDYVEDRLVCCQSGNIAFTHRFVDAYCHDLTNSLIYIGTCHSGEYGALASSFLRKGCNLFIGNSNTVCSSYDFNMVKTFAKKLATPKKGGKYRTAGEAIAEAKDKHGDYCCKKDKATPVLFGNTGYKLKDAADDDLDTPDTTIVTAVGDIAISTTYVSLAVGESKTVDITEYPSGYSSSDFIWASDDTSIATVSGGTVSGVAKGSTYITVRSSDNRFKQSCAIVVT